LRISRQKFATVLSLKAPSPLFISKEQKGKQERDALERLVAVLLEERREGGERGGGSFLSKAFRFERHFLKAAPMEQSKGGGLIS